MSSTLPLCFTAFVGATVGVMLAWVPGHGACPQGEHTNSAVLGIANVSVLLVLGLVDFSVLQ